MRILSFARITNRCCHKRDKNKVLSKFLNIVVVLDELSIVEQN